ncbi:hypothetical protein SERLADRAFT_480553, partial [Serpula lacrymans var. lacrymans S7.9]
MNNYQELCLHLHVLGVYTPKWLGDEEVQRVREETNSETFRGWRNVTSAVCILLVVPRNRIAHVITELDKAGTPVLCCNIRGTQTSNMFSSIHAVFGTLRIFGSKQDKRAVILPDSAGRSGSSPLIISFWAPSPPLMIEPSNTYIHLAVRSSPVTAQVLTPKLGMDLSIFNANLLDEQRVHVLAERPNLDGELKKIVAAAPPKVDMGRTSIATSRLRCSDVIVSMDSTCRRIIRLTSRMTIHSSRTEPSFDVGLKVEQVTLNSVRLCVKHTKKVVVFPLPVDASRGTCRMVGSGHALTLEVSVPPFLADSGNQTKYRSGLIPFLCVSTMLLGAIALILYCLYRGARLMLAVLRWFNVL